MPLNRSNDQQTILEMAIFMSRNVVLRSEQVLLENGSRGSLALMRTSARTLSRMADTYVADLENTTVCKNLSQKGWDLENRTEVNDQRQQAVAATLETARFQIQFMGLTNKEDYTDHIMAVVYSLMCCQKLRFVKIPNSFYRDKTSYSCGVNRHTGNINGLQQYIIDEG